MIRVSLLLAFAASSSGQQAPDFDTEVRPILSDNCFACHGPDASTREAALRLDTREGALALRAGGLPAIVPGNAESSGIWARITSTDAGHVMPPPESHKPPLTVDQQALIRAWVEDGAPWADHWAFVPPVAPELEDPEVHPIDELVARGLDQRDLQLAQPADPSTLARRLALALTGLAPDPAQLVDLGTTPAVEDWQVYVDALLASPHYGERMAMWWLDAARYADTDGFQADDVRSNWPWRDWVVRAFQSNMPLDRFTELQFAGDLLPEAGPEEILATCFHRNHMHNGEGGRDPAESRVDYVRDRVDTMGTALLGLTLSCAQCHDHKFDPVSQRDYYSLTAFFDSIDETGRAGGGAAPFLEYDPGTGSAQIEAANAEVAAASARLAQSESSARNAFPAWLDQRRQEAGVGFEPWHVAYTQAQPNRRGLWGVEGAKLVQEADGSVLCLTPNLDQEDYHLSLAPTALDRVTGLRLEAFSGTSGLAFCSDSEFIVTNVKVRVLRRGSSAVRDVELAHASASHVGQGVDTQYGAPKGVLDDDPRTGWTTRTIEVDSKATLVVALAEPLTLAEDEHIECVIMHRSTKPQAHLRRLRISLTDQPGAAVRSLEEMPMASLARHLQSGSSDKLSDELSDRLWKQFLEDQDDWQDAFTRHARLSAQASKVAASYEPQKVTVLAEREEPRTTYVLERGVWDNHGDVVTRSFPGAVFAGVDGQDLTRLDLAHWVTDRDNPLTARVLVNQVWQLLFGAGLVRTPGDFGLQGARPEYPELLDWLAVDFLESGWDVQHLVKRIVSSRTYQQSSAASTKLLERDPSNEWLARGPRFRMPSWMIRDHALSVSGLLQTEVGGPPVYPHQPEGVWEDLFMGRFRYEPTLGKSRHRRTLYAFWRRNVPPTFLFDAASRRTCDVDMRMTNTPLQALTLLNDRTYVESALALARRAIDESGATNVRTRLAWMARRVLVREMDSDEIQVLESVYRAAVESFAADPNAAIQVVADSEQAAVPLDTHPDPVPLAATTTVANLLFNLDEAITLE